MEGFVPYTPVVPDPDSSLAMVHMFRAHMDGRRTTRMFSTQDVRKEIMAEILRVAGSAPSGAHKQPWTYVAIRSQDLKAKIRAAAEAQEKRFYDELAPDEWLQDLAPLGTDWEKTHLTDAPWVVVIFAQDYALDGEKKRKHYYVNESVGISAGFFIAAVRMAGLCTLTHTPSPMNFLRDALNRPANERAYLVLPVGHAADDAVVPDLRRKELDEFVIWQ